MANQTVKAPASATLLVELLTEELPPKSLQRLSEAFRDALVKDLRASGLLTDARPARCYATPRRLAVSIEGVLGKAPDLNTEMQGPSVAAPPEAVAGFARKNGVAVDQLSQVDTPKGKVYSCRKFVEGPRLSTSLAAKVEAALKALPIPKTMRWGDGEAQFVRPVHGLVMMHGPRVVPGAVMGLDSSNHTLGHRFLSAGRITIKNAGSYEQTLLKSGKVIADFAVRKSEIVNKIKYLCGNSLAPVASEALYDEITALVEAPAVYEGKFAAEFLEVPEECLVLSMQQHQKYVPLRDKATGKLLPRFVFVSNIETKQPREIIHGNERVLRARLSDAKFFYDQDRRTRLETRVPRLASVVYHNKLGSQLERVERIRKLAGTIAGELKADAKSAERAAFLCKADLLTDMVGEFPELQGVMGRYYAVHDGEPKAVAEAIEQHYRPRFAGDALPEGPIGCSVALAEKLSALAGLFGIQQLPSGDKDPFGLRRAALGIVRILVENKLPLNLDTLIASAFDGLPGQPAPANLLVRSFIDERFTSYLKDCGYTTIEIDSVLSTKPQRLDLVPQQLKAVRFFLTLPEAASLAAANKRVDNILKQAATKGESFAGAGRDNLKEPADRTLSDAPAAASQKATPLFKQGDFTGYLKAFAILKTPVDAFFDSIMVMAEDREVRKNRLALLADLREKMNRVADIAKLAA